MQSTDTGPDLGRALEESYGDGPPHRALEPVLRAGRRHRLRRRVLQVSAAVAGSVTVVLVSTQVLGTLGGGDVEVVARPGETASAPVAPSPTPSPTEDSPTVQPGLPDQPEPRLRFGDGEQLSAVPPAVIVSQTGDVEMGPRFAGSGDRTAAAEVTWQGERWYVLARQIDDDPAEYFPVAATTTTPTLDDFLAEAAARYADGTGLR